MDVCVLAVVESYSRKFEQRETELETSVTASASRARPSYSVVVSYYRVYGNRRYTQLPAELPHAY